MSVVFSYSPGPFNHGRLSDEIVAGGVTLLTIRGTSIAVDVECADGTVQATVDAIVAAHSGATPPNYVYPALTGGTTTFVRADGTLATPAYGTITGALTITGIISPAQIVSNTNDYAPTGFSTASVLRLSTDASRNITGLAGGASGRTVWIFNVGGFNIVLRDTDANSAAENRFALDGDITLAPDASTPLWYDGTSSRWRAF